MKPWSLIVVAAVMALFAAPRAADAQTRACQECGMQRCGPPMQQCAQECERPTVPARTEERMEQCRLACQDRLVACMATSCRPCQGTIQASPGVRPFAPRIGPGTPGEGGEGAPAAPAARPRVVTLRRGR